MMTITRWILIVAIVLILPIGCAVPDAAPGQAAANTNTPGFTGRTVVLGNNSTIASDAGATEQQQKWPLMRR